MQLDDVGLVAEVEALDGDAHAQLWQIGRIVRRRPRQARGSLAREHRADAAFAGFGGFAGAAVHGVQTLQAPAIAC